MRDAEVLVLGLGNLLMGDDGVGVHAIRALAARPPRGAVVVDVGTAVWSVADLLTRPKLIIAVDAMQAGGIPGSVYVTGGQDLHGDGAMTSLHEAGLHAVVASVGRDAGEMLVFGIEPAYIECGCELSQAVQRALPSLEEAVRRAIELWRSAPEQRSVRWLIEQLRQKDLVELNS